MRVCLVQRLTVCIGWNERSRPTLLSSRATGMATVRLELFPRRGSIDKHFVLAIAFPAFSYRIDDPLLLCFAQTGTRLTKCATPAAWRPAAVAPSLALLPGRGVI